MFNYAAIFGDKQYNYKPHARTNLSTMQITSYKKKITWPRIQNLTYASSYRSPGPTQNNVNPSSCAFNKLYVTFVHFRLLFFLKDWKNVNCDPCLFIWTFDVRVQA